MTNLNSIRAMHLDAMAQVSPKTPDVLVNLVIYNSLEHFLLSWYPSRDLVGRADVTACVQDVPAWIQDTLVCI